MGRALVQKPKLSERELKAREYWRDNPVEAVKDWFKVTPDDWQGDFLNGLLSKNATFDRVAMKSAHGPGKTTVFSWAGWTFLEGYEDSRVVATAPTMAQLGDVLWSEYAKWYAKMPNAMQARWLISGGHIRSTIHPKTWFAVARTSNKAANLQGFHGSNILVECDEASGIPQEVFEVIEGIMSEAGEEGKIAKLALGGNPNFTSGELYDAFGKSQALYHRLTVTGDPDLLERLGVQQGGNHREHGLVYLSPRVKEKYRKTIYAKYGLDSAVADVRVRGLFPRQDDQSIFPLQWVERAVTLKLPSFDMKADPVTIVLDPARKGGNETVLGAFRRGVPCQPLKARAKTKTHEAADMIEEEILIWHKRGVAIERVVIDEPGIGGGVIDECEKRGIAVTPYNGGMPMVKDIDPEDECRMFKNRRARDHWLVRRRLELANLPLPDDEVLTGQMPTIRYDYRNEKIVIESKQELCDRLGSPTASPDRSDVIVMGCAPWRSFQAANTAIQLSDVITAEDGVNDRPKAEMELW